MSAAKRRSEPVVPAGSGRRHLCREPRWRRRAGDAAADRTRTGRPRPPGRPRGGRCQGRSGGRGPPRVAVTELDGCWLAATASALRGRNGSARPSWPRPCGGRTPMRPGICPRWSATWSGPGRRRCWPRRPTATRPCWRRVAGAPGRVVVSEHNDLRAGHPLGAGRSLARLVGLQRSLYPTADAVVAVSRGVAQDVAARSGAVSASRRLQPRRNARDRHA